MRTSGQALLMNKAREILRLWELGFNQSEIARGAHATRPTVRDYVRRVQAAGLSAESALKLDDEALKTFFGKKGAGRPPSAGSRADFAQLSQELCRKGVTLLLLWQEHLREHPGAVSYSQFCKEFQVWKKSHAVSLRRDYRAGEYSQVDYAGLTVPVRTCGALIQAQIFVGVLCASNLIFAEATPSQKLEHWLMSHVRMFEFFGGVPEAVIPDNLKSGVTHACRYEPGINRAYEELAHHYGIAVLPARVKKPQDKGKGESAVQIVERWILAVLRDREFTSVHELNEAIKPLLQALNTREMKGYGCSRVELFERSEKEALRPLPEFPFVVARWKAVRLHVDYHVEIDKHYYSAPHELIGEELQARINEQTIELFHNHKRVALHLRRNEPQRHSTLAEHRPQAHTAVLQWTPQRFIEWASRIGTETVLQVQGLLNSRTHPEQAYRSILGILRLGEKQGHARLEAACKKANSANVFSFQRIKALLQAEGLGSSSTPEHRNLRGATYYH